MEQINEIEIIQNHLDDTTNENETIRYRCS